jgi:hypothetical protein
MLWIDVRSTSLASEKTPLADMKITQSRNRFAFVLQYFLGKVLDRYHSDTLFILVVHD